MNDKMAYKDIKFAVSLYSYQDNYYFKRLNFEGAIAAAAGSGAEGIEVLGDTMIPEWPYISDEFADRFVGLQYRYGVKGVCFEHWSDRAMWKNKTAHRWRDVRTRRHVHQSCKEARHPHGQAAP